MLKLYCFALLLCQVVAYKFLLVFPIAGRSHGILGDAYVRNLLGAGHEVTYITPYPVKNPPANLHQVDVSETSFAAGMGDIFDIYNIMQKDYNLQDINFMLQLMPDFVNLTMHNENVQKLVRDKNQRFDAIIVEWLYTELFAGLAAVFDCPYIWSSSMETHNMILSLIDEYLNPSYSLHHMTRDHTFSFLERIKQLWHMLYIKYQRWNVESKDNKVYNDAFVPAITLRRPNQRIPDFDEIRYNGSMMLGNTNPVTGTPYSLPQNYKNIGGYHVKDKIEPLSKDLQKTMDEAKHGVIYFSMGSILQSSRMPESLKKGVLDTFRSLKQTVIWKFEDDMSDLPKNVHIVPWVPQQSVLAHPNCVLFITHGGLLSQIETLHFGVPVIGIPMYADQFLNTDRAEAKGFGKRVDLDYDTPAKLKVAIEQIISNPSYRQRAKELSLIFHDRLVSPGKELVHWAEHVVKNKGAPHLRSPALMMPWYQKMYIDLLVVILSVFVSIILLFMFVRKHVRIQYHMKKKVS